MSGQPLDFIKYAADVALGVPNLLQLRPYTTTLNTISWSGSRPGLGSATIVSNSVYNDGYINPRFRQVTREEVVLSGGVLRDQDVVIGPFVFPYSTPFATGGLDPLTFNPTLSNTCEFYINIMGPNFPAAGLQFKKIWDDTQKNVMYRVYLRSTSVTLP